MRIEVRRSGGFAGAARTFSVDTAVLPAQRAAEIERLVRLLAPRLASPDAFSYEVTIDGKMLRGVDADALVDAMIR